jgi:hypothetical protein
MAFKILLINIAAPSVFALKIANKFGNVAGMTTVRHKCGVSIEIFLWFSVEKRFALLLEKRRILINFMEWSFPATFSS